MTVTPGTSPSVVDPIAFHPVKARPALRLPCGRIFAPNLAMLAEQVFESPYFAITADRSYFAANANNRGVMAERVLADELRAAAGRHVVRNIKLHKSGAEKAQIDAAILFGDIDVLFEIKTKRLTELAKRGDDESLIKDLRKGLIEAKKSARGESSDCARQQVRSSQFRGSSSGS
jgi:hypothetical protein